MTGQGGHPPTLELNRVLAKSLEKLAVLEGLAVLEIAARCVLTGQVPTLPAFSREVVTAYSRLEAEQIRGDDTAWQIEEAISGRR
jgi:hypothetical protein